MLDADSAAAVAKVHRGQDKKKRKTATRGKILDTGLTDKQTDWIRLIAHGVDYQQAAIDAGYNIRAGASVYSIAAKNIKNPIVRAALRKATDEQFTILAPRALQKLAEIMNDEKAPHGARATAAVAILDRSGYRYAQKIEHDHRMSPSDRALKIAELQLHLSYAPHKLSINPSVVSTIQAQVADKASASLVNVIDADDQV